jgi:hypothetical protein
MKNLLYSFLFLTLILHSSCGSEEKSESKKVETENNDTLDSISDTLIEKEKLPRKRLPRHMGSWIDQNLDNEVFYSERVDEMVTKSKIKTENIEGEMMDYVYDYLKSTDLKDISVRELIYYALAYPASFSQVCAEGYTDSTPNVPKISGYIPFSYESEEMSDVQWDEINHRRDSVIIVITDYIEENPDKINLEYLRLLKRLDAVEAFPTVMATASKDNLANYSYLLEFMRENEFAPLREVDFYQKMYGEESYAYNSMVEATTTVRKKIIQLAKAFYSDMNEN